MVCALYPNLPGLNWQQGVDFHDQVGVQAHVQHYSKLFKDGKLALGGPFLDSSGGMMVPTPGDSLEEIKALPDSNG